VKIEPAYHGPTVHVLDASRSVGVVGHLLSGERRPGFTRDVRAEYARVRTAYGGRRADARFQPLAEARRRKLALDWRRYTPRQPPRLGVAAFAEYPLAELVRYIDWSPFFRAWELHGVYPRILDDPAVGPAARPLFEDAQRLLQRIVSERRFCARAAFGLFPANAVGDDIEVYADERRDRMVAVLPHLRQQAEKPPDRPNLCLADFVAPKETGVRDYVGGFAVTLGAEVEQFAQAFERAHDDYHAIMTKALGDRLAEAFAERLHQRVRTELWGHAPDEALSNDDLIREKYAGIRPAPGYPACPDHTEKHTLFRLLSVERHTGIALTESCAMLPASSVAGWYIGHPEAFYFGVGKIDRDQVEDYARRKGMPVGEVERWLAPNLAYGND